MTEQVTVTAESPLLETSNATAAPSSTAPASPSCRCSRAARWRSPTLVAGVNYNAQAIYLRPFDNGALADWSMNGGQNRNNEFLLDGAPNNANQGGNNIAYVPPAEAVQEFKISTNSLRRAVRPHRRRRHQHVAQVGHEHASTATVYDFMRRKGLAANSFLLNSRSTPKTDQYIDQYGFSVDGPILQEQDVLPVQRREVPGRHAGPASSARCRRRR